MNFVNEGAEVFIPDGDLLTTTFQRAEGGRIGIGAHQDDLEIFAIQGIGDSFDRSDEKFIGVTVTNGGGSARKGKYADYTDEDMMKIRHEEQNRAAAQGRYSAQFQLNYKSSDIKGPNPPKGDALENELRDILMMARPVVVYVHNPFDRHETHNALRMMPQDMQPQQVFGCEVWGSLDWVPSELKISLDVSYYTDLQRRLIDCFDSQIAGSKNYTTATLGREAANATYRNSHVIDISSAVIYAVDLMPLLRTPDMTLDEFEQPYIEGLRRQFDARAFTYGLEGRSLMPQQ